MPSALGESIIGYEIRPRGRAEGFMGFSTTAVSVLLLVAMAVPGYLLIKTKMLPQKAITYLSVLLLYVSQPFLSIRSFLEVSYTPQLAVNLAIVFGVSLAGQAVIFGVMCLFCAADSTTRSRRRSSSATGLSAAIRTLPNPP